MATYFDLIEVAKALGLQGVGMQNYIDTQLNRQQAEKKEQTEADTKILEAEAKKLEIAKATAEASRLASEAEAKKLVIAKETAEAEEKTLSVETERLLALKEVTEKERENQLAIISKQNELDKEEKKRAFELPMHEKCRNKETTG